jgi:hypothetical protein
LNEAFENLTKNKNFLLKKFEIFEKKNWIWNWKLCVLSLHKEEILLQTVSNISQWFISIFKNV